MKKHPVIITALRDTKNDTTQLALSQEVERPSSTGLVSMLMQGHAGFTKPKPRVAFVTVSKQQMEQFKFVIGQDFSEVLENEVNLQVTEGFKPFRMKKDAKGNLVPQDPKMNPATKAVLTKGGLPIYRNCEAVLGEAKDTLIQHDAVVTVQAPAAKAESVLSN